MHYNLTISPDHIAAARQRPGTVHTATTRKWAQRLADEQVLPDYASRDVIVECTPLLSAHQVIEQVTGGQPFELLHHPGRRACAFGGEYWASATVAHGLLILARLGVQTPVHELLEPLRRKLAQSRAHPLLTPDELAVLWGAREHRGVHTFRYVGAAAPEPYAVTLDDGRTVLGFANPDGQHVEVIGQRGLYVQAERRGCLLPRPEIRALIERASFYSYLRAQRNRRDPVGDLARDAIEDDTFPRSLQSFTDLRDYLLSCSACDGAHKAARAMWAEYQPSEAHDSEDLF